MTPTMRFATYAPDGRVCCSTSGSRHQLYQCERCRTQAPTVLGPPKTPKTSAAATTAPPPPDFNARVHGALAGHVPAPALAPAPAAPTRLMAAAPRVAHDRTAPPPPDFNAAIRAAVAARAGQVTPVAAPVRPLATERVAADDRTAPPPPDFNAAIRAAQQRVQR